MIDANILEILERDPSLAHLVDHVRVLACTLSTSTTPEQVAITIAPGSPPDDRWRCSVLAAARTWSSYARDLGDVLEAMRTRLLAELDWRSARVIRPSSLRLEPTG
jgi:hypothetical protein